MKQDRRKSVTGAGLAAALLLLISAAGASAQTTTPSPPPLSARDKRTVAAFDKRVKNYVALRERVEGKLPKLSTDATPEQIEAHKKAFQDAVRAARAGARPGQLFTPDIAAFIRAAVKEEFKGRDLAELKQTLFEAETKGVPLKVNYPYPESKELLDMPPTLLLRLPQLPKQVKYRFVGKNMLLVDRENGLIIDFMTNAVP
jgi:hypothetical protein